MHYLLFYEKDLSLPNSWQDVHRDYVRAALDRGLLLAGNLDEGAEALLLFETEEVASAFALEDPYVIHGVVRSWRVRPWDTIIVASGHVLRPTH